MGGLARLRAIQHAQEMQQIWNEPGCCKEHRVIGAWALGIEFATLASHDCSTPSVLACGNNVMATTWVKDLLERRGIPYEELHHPDAATASELAEAEHVSGHQVAKTVVVIADDRPFELVLPASRHVDFDRVCDALQAREVRLAKEEEIAELFSDCEPGAVPPLRHWRNVGVLMDQSMRVTGDIIFHAATHRDAVRLRFEDWFKLVNPRVARFSTIGQPTARATYKPHAGEPIATAGEAGRIRQLLDDLLDILHLQAKEIERLTSHVEQQTDSLLQPSQMPLVASEFSALRAKLHGQQAMLPSEEHTNDLSH